MKKDHMGVILEDISDKFDLILESLSFMATSAQLTVVDQRLIRVEEDVRTIKKVVTDEGKDVRQRLSRLENPYAEQ